MQLDLDGIAPDDQAHTAKLDLGSMGAADRAALLPGEDGTWTVVRARVDEANTLWQEVYRVEHVTELRFRSK